MPRINKGQVVAGIDYRVSINGAVPPALKDIRAGAWEWWSDTEVAGNAQRADGKWTVYKYDYYTQELVDMSTVFPEMLGGANSFYCGSGQWAFDREDNGVWSVYSSWGMFPGAAVFGVSAYGTMMLKPQRLAAEGLELYFRNHTLDPIRAPHAAQTREVVLRDNLLLYINDNTLKYAIVNEATGDVVQTEADAPLGAALTPGRLCNFPGAAYFRCHEATDSGMWIYQWGSARGWHLGIGEGAYRPDIEALEDGTLMITSSLRAGERPEDLKVYRLDPRNSTLLNAASGTWVPEPVYPLPSSLRPPVFAPTQHPMWVIPYDEPNAIYLADVDSPVTELCRGNYVGLEGEGTLQVGPVWAAFPSYYNRAVQRSIQNGLPLYLYFDNDYYPDWFIEQFYRPAVELGVNVIATFQAYPKPGDDLEGRVRHIETTLRRLAVKNMPTAMSMAFYTQQGNWQLQHVLDLQEVVYKLGEAYGVEALLPFDWVRPSGITTYPELMKAVTDMRKAVLNHPTWPPVATVPDIQTPVVTVLRFDSVVKPGMVWEVVDSANPSLNYHFTVSMDNNHSIIFRITNKQGAASTGLPRKIFGPNGEPL